MGMRWRFSNKCEELGRKICVLLSRALWHYLEDGMT